MQGGKKAQMQKQRLSSAGNSPNSNTRSILVCIQQTPACTENRHKLSGGFNRGARMKRGGGEQSVSLASPLPPPSPSPRGLLVRTEHRTLTSPSAHLNLHEDKNTPHYYSRLTGGYLLSWQPTSCKNTKRKADFSIADQGKAGWGK